MSIPSVNKISSALACSMQQASLIRGLLSGKYAPSQFGIASAGMYGIFYAINNILSCATSFEQKMSNRYKEWTQIVDIQGPVQGFDILTSNSFKSADSKKYRWRQVKGTRAIWLAKEGPTLIFLLKTSQWTIAPINEFGEPEQVTVLH